MSKPSANPPGSTGDPPVQTGEPPVNSTSPSPRSVISPPSSGKTRRAYSPRISKKGAKNFLVSEKEAELRDARILPRLIAQIASLSPWGRSKLEELIKGLPVQPDLTDGEHTRPRGQSREAESITQSSVLRPPSSSPTP